MTQTLTLTKPITAHGDTLEELTFREGTTADIIKCGFPMKYYISSDPEVKEQEAKVDVYVATQLIIELTGIPRSSVNQLAPKDFMDAVGIATSFFGQEENVADEES